MKRFIGILLLAAKYLIYVGTILAAIAYLLFSTLWMHAPVLGILQVISPIALLALALAWMCGRIGRHLWNKAPLIPTAPTERWLLAGVGVVVFAGSATTLLSWSGQYKCSIDPSQTAAARKLQVSRDGFERVCEGALARYDISLDPIDRATGGLAFAPVDLTHTPFSAFESLGGKAEYFNEVPSRLYRGFLTPNGHRLTLSEHDMSADGSRAWRDPQDEPERVNGLPARLTVLEDSSGDAVSLLSWIEGRRFYELWIDANVVTAPLREQLFTLAASLPPSIPGCPNEVSPKPHRPGPDGFPLDEEMPLVLTQAEVNAMFDETKRPCK